MSNDPLPKQPDEESNTINSGDIIRHNIVVTGFGPFRDHLANPSWEAIKDGNLGIDRADLNIITQQVSVAYDEVDRIVSNLWEEHKPLLMVHIGLAAFESKVRLEQVARHGPYIHDDVVGQAPHKELRQYVGDQEIGSLEENLILRDYTCKPCQFTLSNTCLDVERICERLNEAFEEGRISIQAKVSRDAGLYVCEYIYQKSLRVCDRTVFIHVPDTKDFKIEEIRATLKLSIELLADEVLKLTKNGLNIHQF